MRRAKEPSSTGKRRQIHEQKVLWLLDCRDNMKRIFSHPFTIASRLLECSNGVPWILDRSTLNVESSKGFVQGRYRATIFIRELVTAVKTHQYLISLPRFIRVWTSQREKPETRQLTWFMAIGLLYKSSCCFGGTCSPMWLRWSIWATFCWLFIERKGLWLGVPEFLTGILHKFGVRIMEKLVLSHCCLL